MKVCLCFTGLMRTFSKTVENIKKNIISSDHEYTIIYCCWTTENTEDFEREFPNAYIKRIEKPDINGEEFQTWYKNIKPCIWYEYIGFGNTLYTNVQSVNKLPNYDQSKNDTYIYNYYLQIYGYKQMSKYIEDNEFLNSYDIFIRLRCDCIYNKTIYTEFNNIKEDTLYCSAEPCYREFIEHESICDQFFMGSRNTIITVLGLVDYYNDLKINGTDRRFNYWENAYHPETTLYKALIWNCFTEKYIDGLEIQLIR